MRYLPNPPVFRGISSFYLLAFLKLSNIESKVFVLGRKYLKAGYQMKINIAHYDTQTHQNPKNKLIAMKELNIYFGFRV